MAAIIGIPAALYAWRLIREEGLRRNDVLAWANEVIAQLESLFLICDGAGDTFLLDVDADAILKEIAFKTAILVEQGRLLFRNQSTGEFGMHKELAYQGIRPLILDHVVVAHQIAREWKGSDRNTQLRMHVIAEDCLKKFTSLAQMEVGRSRTSSVEAAAQGDGYHLNHLIEMVDADRLEKLRRTISRTAN